MEKLTKAEIQWVIEMEQGSSINKEEVLETMTITEVIRMNNWLRAKGLSDKEILDCQNYIATGVGLPDKEPKQSKEPN